MELIDKVKAMTNDSGREMFRWGDYEVIGIEDRKESNWFYAIVKYKGDKKGGVYVLSMPKKDSGCKASHFSHRWYFALLVSQESAGIKVVWNNNGWPTWPTWICRDEAKLQWFFSEYKTLLERYGFTDITIRRNYYETKNYS